MSTRLLEVDDDDDDAFCRAYRDEAEEAVFV